MCLQAPKYGNDDDYVDTIARDLYQFIIDEEAKYKTVQRPGGGQNQGYWRCFDFIHVGRRRHHRRNT